MSGPYPPDPPTQRLDPVRPEPVVRERVTELPPEPLAARVASDLQSLRWWMALVSILALIALAVGIFALLESDEAQTAGNSDDAAAIADLRDRVQNLERDAEGGTASSSEVRRLRREVADKVDAETLQGVQQTVNQLQQDFARVERSSAQEGGAQDIEQLEAQVSELSRQVLRLQEQVAREP